jgi:hypothetical protein
MGELTEMGYIGGEKSVYYAFLIISCQQRVWKQPSWLGEIQAVSTHKPNPSSCVGGRVLIAKVMVGGGR